MCAQVVSHVWSTIRGRIAGIVYSSSPDHPIIARQYVKPVYPNTYNQQLIKDAFGAAVKGWYEAGSTFRDSYSQWAQQHQVPGGGRRKYIASHAFFNYYHNIGVITGGWLDEVPAVYGEPIMECGEEAYSGDPSGSFGVALKIRNISEVNLNVIVRRSIPFKATRNRCKGPFPVFVANQSIDAGDSKVIQALVPDGISDSAVFLSVTPYFNGAAIDPTPLAGFFVGPPQIYRTTVLENS